MDPVIVRPGEPGRRAVLLPCSSQRGVKIRSAPERCAPTRRSVTGSNAAAGSLTYCDKNVIRRAYGYGDKEVPAGEASALSF
jgi:hypothetical protein